MDKVKSLTMQLDQMREHVDIAYDVGEGRANEKAQERIKFLEGHAHNLAGALENILMELKERDIHLMSKHCWCEPVVENHETA